MGIKLLNNMVLVSAADADKKIMSLRDSFLFIILIFAEMSQAQNDF